MTGQGRTNDQWKADYGACYEKVGFKPDELHLPLNDRLPAFTKCMSERGWRVVVEPVKNEAGHPGGRTRLLAEC
jgi:hypothetical protein